MKTYDAIIIGAGSAGLSAAKALGRSRRQVLVIDSQNPRNAAASNAHNVLGNEAISPQALLALGRAEAESYGVEIINDNISTASGSLEEGFTVHGESTSWHGQRILLATGLHDQLPDIPGLQDAWGQSALHCAYCHGWEVRDKKIAILGLSEMSSHQALIFRQFSQDLTFINHRPEALTSENRAFLTELNIPVIDAQVESMKVTAKHQIEHLMLTNGQTLDVQAVVVASHMVANAQIFVDLGGKVSENPLGQFVEADQLGVTTIPGVYAAGNITNLGAMVMAAAAAGTLAGIAINGDLAMTATKSTDH